jgi:predicted dienelactone hydrolase
MNRKWIIITLCILVLVTAAIGIRLTTQAVANAPADQTGPYKVGFVANTYHDGTRSDDVEGARPIMTYIWYPAASDNNGNPMEPAVYELGLNGVSPFSSTDFEAYGVDPAYQEVATSKEGPFPLIVLSPGMPAHPLFYVHIGARLASHGFVVAIPYNYGDGALGEPTWELNSPSYMIGTYIDRTRDIQYLMTQLVADSQQSGNLLSGAIQPDKIAVAGHSWGGLAALALAGGDDRACDFLVSDLDPDNLPPELCVSILSDTRIKAIVPLDPSNLYFLHYAEMARIKIPSMIIGREWNTLEPSNEEALLARPHAAIQGHPNYRVDIANYQHMSFSSACASFNVFRELNGDEITDSQLKLNCPKEPAQPDEIGNLTTRYMIAFLKTVLVGGTGYKEMLTTDYAVKNEPFIEFFETEQGSPISPDEDGYFSYFKHQLDTEQAKALKDPFLNVP